MSRMKMMNRSQGGGDESMVDMIRKTSGEDAKLRMMLGMDAKEDHPTPPNDYFSYGTLKHERQKPPVPDYSRRQARATGGPTGYGMDMGNQGGPERRHQYAIGESVGQPQNMMPNGQQPAQAGMGAGGSGYGAGYGVQQNPGAQQPERRTLYADGGNAGYGVQQNPVGQQGAPRPMYADGGSTGYGADRGNNDGNIPGRRDLYNQGGATGFGADQGSGQMAGRRDQYAPGGGIEIEIKRIGRGHMNDRDMEHMGEVDRMERRHGQPRHNKPEADIDEGFMEVLDRHGIPLHALSERDMAVLGRRRQSRATGGSMDMGRLKEKSRRFEDHEPRQAHRGGRGCHAAGAVAKVRKGLY